MGSGPAAEGGGCGPRAAPENEGVLFFACLLACFFLSFFLYFFLSIFVCLFVCSFVRSFVRLFVCVFVCSCLRVFVCSFVRSVGRSVWFSLNQIAQISHVVSKDRVVRLMF